MLTFVEAKQQFDEGPGLQRVIKQSLVPVNGKIKKDIIIRNAEGKPTEEYYKWQFIYSLIYSGLYPKDYIGVEVHFPKGNKAAAPLKIDGAVFDSAEWLQKYNDYWQYRRPDDLQWLNDHLIAVMEFKRDENDEKDMAQIFIQQIKPAMREKEPSNAYVLGIYYDKGRLFLFHRRDGRYLRYDESLNQRGDDSSGPGDLSLHLPDPYHYIPSFVELKNLIHKTTNIDRTKRTIHDLEVIPSRTTVQMKDALFNVLQTMDKQGLVNQRGYEILLQTFALKIFDEKCSENNPSHYLRFYILDEERDFSSLNEEPIQRFITRMQAIRDEATGQYDKLLQRTVIDWQDQSHIRVMAEACYNFQDYSFVRSSRSDLYQLVFYNFANKFQQHEKAQFLTPLAIIEFIVKLVNPCGNDTVFDPCCGIGDFLSVSYVQSQGHPGGSLNDENIYGADVSPEMIALSSLNMLLNGDGRSHLFHVPDKGSILWKIKASNPPEPVQLIPSLHKKGNWDTWNDKTRLMKFDVILTNPPFGDNRSYRIQSKFDREVIEMYETWFLGNGKDLDLGVVFLENAYRCLKENGRLGIVLSNSIASINTWAKVREWLMERMRIVALFDLPPNVFAETGARTCILIAYKPDPKELEKLNQQGYSVFTRVIKNVGYEKRTLKRNVFFNPTYLIDEKTFDVVTDSHGRPVLKEDFTTILTEFRQWALGQEETLQKLFLKGIRNL